MSSLATIFIVYCCVLVATAQSTPLNEDYDVIIVGAGLTGLNAAHEIRKTAPGARVKLLEVRDQVGGRIRARTMRTTEGDVWLDTGSQFISPTATALTTMANEFGLPLFAQTNCGTRTLDIRTKRLSESESLTTRRSFRDVINSTEMSSWASRNVHDYLLSTGQTKSTMDTANRLLQTLFDSPDKSVSIIHLLLAAASENATVADLLSRYGHGQALFMQGGLNRLTRAMAEKLDVQLGQTVTSIEEGDSVVTVKTPTDSYTARQVIVTAPPVVASAIQFTPPLEAQFAQFLESYRPSGRAYYFTMTFANPFWRGKGMSGQIIHTNPRGPIVWLTTFDVGKPTMCAGLGATGVLWGIAHFSEELTPELRRAAYMDIVTGALGGKGSQPLDFSEEHYSADPFARGSIAVLPPNIDITSLRFLKAVNDHGERVLFASAEYSNVSMGLMNGAVLSGKTAGATVARRLRKADETNREDNEVANLVRLNDEVAKTTRLLEGTVERKRTNESTPVGAFVYNTSTHYPVTDSIEATTFKHFSFGNVEDDDDESDPSTITQNDDTTGGNAGVDTATEGTSFVYHTSTLNPPAEPLETSTFKHFSFGNADPAPPFVPPPRSSNPVITATIPTTTTTVRTTFTPIDRNRITTPFQYRTSTINPLKELVEVTPFKHFSNGNVDEASSNPASDIGSSTYKEDIARKLKEILDELPKSSSLQIARRLSAILHDLLLSMSGKRP